MKRLRYAKEMLEKPLGFWETVVWSDESKFNLFDLDWESDGMEDAEGGI